MAHWERQQERDEKLEAIRARARREAAERKQAELARGRNRPERPEASGTMFRKLIGAGLVFAAVALVYVAIQPEEKPPGEDPYRQLAEDLIEAEKTAVARAGLEYLSTLGWDIGAIDSIEGEALGGTVYLVRFTQAGEQYQLRGQLVCPDDLYNLQQRMQAACYRWE